jgi:cytochrome c553
MKRILVTATLVVASLGMSGIAQAAGDVAAGKTKSARCVACHPADGKVVPPNPGIAGKPEADLVKALKDYKSGAKNNAVMKGITAALSDQDMEDLSAFYASLK